MTVHLYDLPMLTVDVALLSIVQGQLRVALLRRPEAPFKDAWALPGGVVRLNSDLSVEQTALRMLKDKLHFEPTHLEQVVTVSGPARDPRGWSASVLHLALMEGTQLEALTVQPGVQLHAVDTLPPLAFDHEELVALAVSRLQSKAKYSTLAAHLLPARFTLPMLEDVTEILTGQPLNSGNFRRKVLEREMLVPTTQFKAAAGAGRPAQLYELAPGKDYLSKSIA